MQRRHCRRNDLNVTALITCPCVEPVFADVSDVGMGGIGIATPVALPLDADVLLHLRFKREGITQTFHLGAKVVRRTGEGAALMFAKLDRTTRRALHRTMQSEASGGPSVAHWRRFAERPMGNRPHAH